MKRLLLLTIIALVFFVTLFPFYWMLRTALSNGKSLASNPSSLLPADFTWGAFKRVLGLSTVEQAQAEGGSGADINFWLYLRNSVIVSVAITAGQVFFSRDGRLRLRPDALPRPGQDLRPVPRRADGPADLHDDAELPADQAARPAEHPDRASSCRSSS